MKIGDLCEVVRGSSPRPKSDPRYYGGTVPRLMVADLTRDGKIVSARIDSLTELGAKQSRLMQQGDMVIAVSGAPGLPAILAHEACIHDGFVGLRNLNLKRVCPNFLYSYLTFIRTTSKSQAVGAIFKNLTTDQIKRIDIPELPLEEQRRIAEVLDRAEELRSKRREAIAQLDTLTQAIFLEMFGDPVLNGWATETIADIVHPSSGSIRTGPFGSQLLHSEFVEEGVAVLGIDNAVANEFRWGERRFISELKYRGLKRYTVKPGDVIITIMGTCGRCAVVPDNIPVAINTKHLCCITLNQEKCLPRFLHAYFLLHPIARQYLNQTEKGAIMAGLNMGIIKSMPIFIPPLSLQKEFARRLEAVEKLKAGHRASLSELDALFASLQHRAFRGEL